MTQRYPDFIWHNGEVKRWQDATVHVMAHGLHYGSSVFEGIRCYETHRGPAIFRLTDHNKRLFASARIYEMPIPYTLEQLNQACRDVIKANDLGQCYLRPIAYRDLGGFGLSADCPTSVAVAACRCVSRPSRVTRCCVAMLIARVTLPRRVDSSTARSICAMRPARSAMRAVCAVTRASSASIRSVTSERDVAATLTCASTSLPNTPAALISARPATRQVMTVRIFQLV